MNENPLSDPRRIVPRWRNFDTTLRTGELDTPAIVRVNEITTDPVFYDEKRRAWESRRTIEAAIDLLESAIVHGETDEVKEAAELITENGDQAGAAAVRIAACILDGPQGDSQQPLFRSSDIARQRARELRIALREYPRNVFLWVDLARAYCILGQMEPAIRAIETALALSDTNRFVLRSAARLFIHAEDPEFALQLLRKSARTRHDPWLLSSEIATASVAEKPQSHIKLARQLLRSENSSPFELSELASAVGTVAMYDGNITPARRLFRQSLIVPTDNAVAQAEWANSAISGIRIDEAAYELPFSYEARARNAVRSGRWERGLQHCENWRLDEPFSSLPSIAGSYYAAVALQDFEAAEDFARAGLTANPTEPTLLNNLSVALACQGRADDAANTLASILSADRQEHKITILATEGLIAFRNDKIDEGRKKYREAIELAKKTKKQDQAALASLHLAREEERAHSLDNALAALRDARSTVKKGEPALEAMLTWVEKALERSRSGEKISIGRDT